MAKYNWYKKTKKYKHEKMKEIGILIQHAWEHTQNVSMGYSINQVRTEPIHTRGEVIPLEFPESGNNLITVTFDHVSINQEELSYALDDWSHNVEI